MQEFRRHRSIALSCIGLAGLTACGIAAMGSSRLRAEAALAVGLPGDVAEQGLAMGWALNYPTTEAAQAEALKRCRNFQDAPQSTKDLCKIAESFRHRCLCRRSRSRERHHGVGLGRRQGPEAGRG